MARLIPQLDFSPTLKSKQVLMIFVALLSLAGASLSCELPHILDHRVSMPLLCPRSCEPWAQSTLHVSITFKPVFFLFLGYVPRRLDGWDSCTRRFHRLRSHAHQARFTVPRATYMFLPRPTVLQGDQPSLFAPLASCLAHDAWQLAGCLTRAA